MGIAFLLFFYFSKPQKLLITNNGNLLFYNSPSAIQVKNNIYISYVTNNGKIIVKKYLKFLNKTIFIQEYLVHDYTKSINHKIGNADDHSAPAIIYDDKNKRILLATAYHGTNLYLYEFDLKNNKWCAPKIFEGKYTYPRFMSWNHDIYILYRSQHAITHSGDLVVRSSLDSFDKENTIVKAQNETVIYASSPFVFKDSFFITYSTHIYSENRLKGWKALQVNFSDLTNSREINLEKHLDKNYFANRPTAIAVNEKSIYVGTAIYFNEWKEQKNYNDKNKVVIIEFNLKNSNNFKVKLSNLTHFPYYATSISLDDKGNYIYFDKNKIISSFNNISLCKTEKNMMYSYLFGDNLLYAYQNSSYSIRDFNNSIVLCTGLY